jgi:hypothetical protein
MHYKTRVSDSEGSFGKDRLQRSNSVDAVIQFIVKVKLSLVL